MKLATVKYFFLTFFLSILTVFGQTPEELVNMKNPPKKLVQDYARVFDAMQLNDLENKLKKNIGSKIFLLQKRNNRSSKILVKK